jgi:type II secretory pathway pseudopilin PulG
MRRRAGFTAEEILMALLIIGLAISAVQWAGSAVREAARSTSCVSNVRELGLALRMYAADNAGRLPPGPRDFPALIPYVAGISALTGTYGHSPAIFRCPNDPAPATLPFILQSGGKTDPVRSSYLLNPTAQLDDLPSVILAGDDVSNRHQGRRWVGVRLDGAAQLYPAKSWEEKLGWVIRHDDATK